MLHHNFQEYIESDQMIDIYICILMYIYIGIGYIQKHVNIL